MKKVALKFDTGQLKVSLMKAVAPVVKYHMIITIVAVSSFLIFALLTVNTILSDTDDAAYLATQQEAAGIKSTFDAKTITKINELRSRQENPSLSLPTGGRLNPFKE